MVKVYTRTGDDGTTHCFKSGRIQKDDCLLEAIGSVDELNSQIGLLSSLLIQCQSRERQNDAANNDNIELTLSEIKSIQNRLFDLGGALATYSAEKQFIELLARIDETPLELWIDRMDEDLPPIRQFILPGGSVEGSQAHVCRSVCRRAERQVVAVFGALQNEAALVTEGIAKLMKYLNRLSDYLFVLARYLNLKSKQGEVFWTNENDEK